MNVLSGAPTVQLTGIEDRSIRTPLPQGEELPMHLPFLVLDTQRGPETTQLVGGADATRMYGVDSFDENKAYCNHATMMYNTVNGRGNVCMIKRAITEAHKKAHIRLCLEVVDADIPLYKRYADGSLELDQNGDKIPTGSTVPGKLMRWIREDFSEQFPFGQAAKKQGGLAGRDGAVSTVYPWYDFEVTHYGAYGNNVGLSFEVPTLKSTQPVNDSLVDDNEAVIWRLKFVERPDAQSGPVVTQTLFGTQNIEFMLKRNTKDAAVNKNMHIDKQLLKNYRDVDSKGFAPIFGPMDNYKVYEDNIAEVLSALNAAEHEYGDIDYELDHMVNPLTCLDVEGNPYVALQVVGPENGGLLFGPDTYHYASNGADGEMTLDKFDKAVKGIFDNFENGDEDFMDSALFPFSCFYDSGFGIETKKSMLLPIGLRKDVYTVLSTQDVKEEQNTADEEQSVAIALRARARLYPESVEYGTSTCRAVIVGHSGTLINATYDKLLPLTVDFADKCAAYMGASHGSMKEEFSMDTSPLNNVTMFRDINCLYKNPRVRQKDWAAGLVWVQRVDRSDFFYPAYQTVYDNDTSVINSAINMFIAVELEKVCERTWRRLAGDTKLTDGQFYQKSNKIIEDFTKGRFDGRVIIEAETYKSDEDKQRGYSWTTKLHMYANNMRTVGTYTVTANRREDYVG